jgi:hypothetical protein
LGVDIQIAWRGAAAPDGERPYDFVFQTLATFPLPGGLQSFRPDVFMPNTETP